MKQKDTFLNTEGNEWFKRNKANIDKRKFPEDDRLLMECIELIPFLRPGMRLLEIGCGNGAKLAWLKNETGIDCYGVEPSIEAVKEACSKGLNVKQGTADEIDFGDNEFDFVIFGFCLYLCDREDLFQISKEADRVLKSPGWLLISDFYSPSNVKCDYHHKEGIHTYKMDYKTLFTWHPAYECFTHKVRHHEEKNYTDEENEWVSVSVLRKNYTDKNS